MRIPAIDRKRRNPGIAAQLLRSISGNLGMRSPLRRRLHHAAVPAAGFFGSQRQILPGQLQRLIQCPVEQRILFHQQARQPLGLRA